MLSRLYDYPKKMGFLDDTDLPPAYSTVFLHPPPPPYSALFFTPPSYSSLYLNPDYSSSLKWYTNHYISQPLIQIITTWLQQSLPTDSLTSSLHKLLPEWSGIGI
jgi:hypothetical protein